MKATLISVSTAVAVLLLMAGCSPNIEIQARIGERAPPFTLSLTDGRQFVMDGQPGNAKAITFMSSWCPCSNESIPLLKKVHSDYEGREIDFLMVGIQDPESKFRAFVDKHDLPFDAGYDDDEIIARTYGVNAPPTTVFIDRTGTLRRVFYGNIKEMEGDVFKWVEELL